jgi:hypothetical protein
MKKSIRTSVVILAMASMGALLYSGFAPISEASVIQRLRQQALMLPVKPLQQMQVTSCGEAAITMAYNYAYSQGPIRESDVIVYATEMGYFTPDRIPFTSPANMVKIARNYTNDISTGRVLTQDQGLRLLVQKLQMNEPIVIDVRTRLDDPTAGAHFVVVTGISIDSATTNTILIHYNDPLTGQMESAIWTGEDGIWNAWQNNDDPGGSGWWMTIGAA